MTYRKALTPRALRLPVLPAVADMLEAVPKVDLPVGAVQLVVTGPPRTKKTHGQIVHLGKKCPVCRRGSSPRLLPSPTWRAWNRDAVIWARGMEGVAGDGWFRWPLTGMALQERPYNVAATFYRDAARGDAVGYYQGLADLLQEHAVVLNDVVFAAWDGSALRKDSTRPRTEVLITRIE